MSINKVLNRPMFRREALKQGYLKPIKAQTGAMVVYQPPGAGVPVGQSFVPPGGNPKFMPVKYKAPNVFSRFGTGLRNFATGAVGPVGLYSGLADVSPTAASALGGAELLGLGLGLSKSTAGVGSALTGISRYVSKNPIVGLAALIAGQSIKGGRQGAEEREMVKEYAKAKGIDEKRALQLYEKDVLGLTRGIGEYKPSDIMKSILESQKMNLSIAQRKELEDQVKLNAGVPKRGVMPVPGGVNNSDKATIKAMNKYVTESRETGIRKYQDIDQLAKQATNAYSQMSNTPITTGMQDPDTMYQASIETQRRQDAKEQEAYNATFQLAGTISEGKNVDPAKAINVAAAVTQGKIPEGEINTYLNDNDKYATIENVSNDPNHPAAKAAAEEEKKQGGTTTNANVDYQSAMDATKTGDPIIDAAKQNLVDLENPRNTEFSPKLYFLAKLAQGMISGKTTRGGLAGAVEVAAEALGPAMDSAIALKMKNDEAFREYASMVYDRNLELMKLRNEAAKTGKFDNGSIQLRGVQLTNGQVLDGFYEAKRDRDTGAVQVKLSIDAPWIDIDPNEGQFYKEQQGADYIDQVKNIVDGSMAQNILKDSLRIMQSPDGKSLIGASGVILSIGELLQGIPGEIRDGVTGIFGNSFTMSNAIDPLSEEAFNKLDERSKTVLKNMEKKFEKGFKELPTTTVENLGKLKVNARFLTYTIANALKEKDRLTNRDLDLLEELTNVLTVREPDAKIIQKYEELLQRVAEKQRLRKTSFYVKGYTPLDVEGIMRTLTLENAQVPADRKQSVDDSFNILLQSMGL